MRAWTALERSGCGLVLLAWLAFWAPELLYLWLDDCLHRTPVDGRDTPGHDKAGW